MHCICVQLLAYISVSVQTLLKKEEKNEKNKKEKMPTKIWKHLYISFSIHVSLV